MDADQPVAVEALLVAELTDDELVDHTALFSIPTTSTARWLNSRPGGSHQERSPLIADGFAGPAPWGAATSMSSAP